MNKRTNNYNKKKQTQSLHDFVETVLQTTVFESMMINDREGIRQSNLGPLYFDVNFQFKRFSIITYLFLAGSRMTVIPSFALY